MTDGIIKGSGNSRYLKSVANFMALYPTYESFAQALIAGTLPIDLYGINPNGWQVRGDDLTKANLLKDATADLYGKGTTATVDDILAAIRPLITTAQSTANGRAAITVSSYTGTGTLTNAVSIRSDAKLVLITEAASPDTYGRLDACARCIAIRDQPYVSTMYYSSFYKFMGCIATWYSASLRLKTNDNDSTFRINCNEAGKRYYVASIS